MFAEERQREAARSGSEVTSLAWDLAAELPGADRRSMLSDLGALDGTHGRGLADIEMALDPVGAVDRDKASAELSSKFTVIDDTFTGTRLPNMVTADEYDQIVQTYSDVRLGRSDLRIDAGASKDPAQYEADMMDDIGDIMQTESGRALVMQLSNNTNGVDADGNPIHHQTRLMPYLDAAGDPDTSGAITGTDASPGIGSPYADGTPGVGHAPFTVINPNLDVVGSPGTWRSDVALYHELVHAMHDTAGTTDVGLVQESDGLQREAGRGNLWGIAAELVNPDPGVVSDAANRVDRSEHQAAGLGLHANDAITENAYRAERNLVAASGQGLSGDRDMPQRDRYFGYDGTYTHSEDDHR